MIEPGFETWAWKDEDELDEAQALGLMTVDEGTSARNVAQLVLNRVLVSEQEEAKTWIIWRPPSDWSIPSLKSGWENL
jgi:hypothetical protein